MMLPAQKKAYSGASSSGFGILFQYSNTPCVHDKSAAFPQVRPSSVLSISATLEGQKPTHFQVMLVVTNLYTRNWRAPAIQFSELLNPGRFPGILHLCYSHTLKLNFNRCDYARL